MHSLYHQILALALVLTTFFFAPSLSLSLPPPLPAAASLCSAIKDAFYHGQLGLIDRSTVVKECISASSGAIRKIKEGEMHTRQKREVLEDTLSLLIKDVTRSLEHPREYYMHNHAMPHFNIPTTKVLSLIISLYDQLGLAKVKKIPETLAEDMDLSDIVALLVSLTKRYFGVQSFYANDREVEMVCYREVIKSSPALITLFTSIFTNSITLFPYASVSSNSIDIIFNYFFNSNAENFGNLIKLLNDSIKAAAMGYLNAVRSDAMLSIHSTISINGNDTSLDDLGVLYKDMLQWKRAITTYIEDITEDRERSDLHEYLISYAKIRSDHPINNAAHCIKYLICNGGIEEIRGAGRQGGQGREEGEIDLGIDESVTALCIFNNISIFTDSIRSTYSLLQALRDNAVSADTVRGNADVVVLLSYLIDRETGTAVLKRTVDSHRTLLDTCTTEVARTILSHYF